MKIEGVVTYPELEEVIDDADGIPVTGPSTYFYQKDMIAINIHKPWCDFSWAQPCFFNCARHRVIASMPPCMGPQNE